MYLSTRKNDSMKVDDTKVSHSLSSSSSSSSVIPQNLPLDQENMLPNHQHPVVDTDMNEMMSIEIHFGKGRSDTVHVRFDDKPEDLARKFIERNRLKIKALGTITEYIKRTIDDFKKSSIEIKPQSPTQASFLILENIEEENRFLESNEKNMETASMYSISGPQEPTELPPSPDIKPIRSSRNQNNRISLDPEIHENFPITMIENSQENAMISDIKGLDLLPPTPPSRSNSLHANDTSRSQKKSSRRMSDGIIFSTLRTLAKWSPPSSFRVDPNKIDKSQSSVPSSAPITPRSELLSHHDDNDLENNHEKDDFHTKFQSNESDYHISNPSEVEEKDKISDASDLNTGRSKSIESENAENVENVDSVDTTLIAADILSKNTSAPSLAYPINDSPLKYQSVNGSFGDIDGLGIPDNTRNKQSIQTQEDTNDSNLDDEANAEDTYYRIQQNFYKPLQPQQQQQSSSSLSPFTPPRIHLQPKSSILSLVNNGLLPTNTSSATRISSLMAKQRAAKTAHERLYLSACIAKERKEKTEKLKEDEIIKELQTNQFKMNKKSRSYSANKRRVMLPIPNSPSSGNFHKSVMDKPAANFYDRLYEEAKYDLLRKSKLVELNDQIKKNIPPDDYWSCSRCGNIHNIKRPVITSLYTFSVREPDNSRICKKCSWDQTNQQDFKPINIGLSLLPNNDEMKEAMERRKQQQLQQLQSQSHQLKSTSIFGMESDETPTIHDILYKNTQNKQTKLIYMQAITQIHDRENTFHPAIPETSKEVLRQKIEKETLFHPESPELYTSSNETKIGEYFSLPPHERLYKTKHLRSDPYLDEGKIVQDQQMLRIQQLNSIMSPNSSRTISPGQNKLKKNTSYLKKDKKLSKKMKDLIDRLTSEFDKRNQAKEKATKEYYAKDPTTGLPYFKPKIGPPPPTQQYHHDYLDSGSNQNNINLSHPNRINKSIFDELHEEDKKKRSQLLATESQVDENMKSYLKRNQVHALPESDHILQQSTQNRIDELYRLLLATNMVVAYHRQYHLEVSQEELTLHISQEADELKDHENDENNWKLQAVDLNQLNLALLVPSIRKLIQEVKVEKTADKINTKDMNMTSESERKSIVDLNNSMPDMEGVVDYEDFSRLVQRAMKRREGTGKWYVIPPKKRDDAVVEMIQNRKANQTYAPSINPISKELSGYYRQHHRGHGIKTVDALYHEAKAFESHRKSKKQSLLDKEQSELTFQPNLYRPPSNIRPRYRDPASSIYDTTNQSTTTTTITTTTAAAATTATTVPLRDKDNSVSDTIMKRSSSAIRRKEAETRHIQSRRSVSRQQSSDLIGSVIALGNNNTNNNSTAANFTTSRRSSSASISSRLSSKPIVSKMISSSTSPSDIQKSNIEFDRILSPNKIVTSVANKSFDSSPVRNTESKNLIVSESRPSKATSTTVTVTVSAISLKPSLKNTRSTSRKPSGSYMKLHSFLPESSYVIENSTFENQGVESSTSMAPPLLPYEHLHPHSNPSLNNDSYASTNITKPKLSSVLKVFDPITTESNEMMTTTVTKSLDIDETHESKLKEVEDRISRSVPVSPSGSIFGYHRFYFDKTDASKEGSINETLPEFNPEKKRPPLPHQDSRRSVNSVKSHASQQGSHTSNHNTSNNTSNPNPSRRASHPIIQKLNHKDKDMVVLKSQPHSHTHLSPTLKLNHGRRSKDDLIVNTDDYGNHGHSRHDENRLSLSSMLSSLIHGDTPKAPAGKHLSIPLSRPTTPVVEVPNTARF